MKFIPRFAFLVKNHFFPHHYFILPGTRYPPILFSSSMIGILLLGILWMESDEGCVGFTMVWPGFCLPVTDLTPEFSSSSSSRLPNKVLRKLSSRFSSDLIPYIVVNVCYIFKRSHHRMLTHTGRYLHKIQTKITRAEKGTTTTKYHCHAGGVPCKMLTFIPNTP